MNKLFFGERFPQKITANAPLSVTKVGNSYEFSLAGGDSVFGMIAAPVDFAAGINAVSTAPATAVTYGGSLYVCTTSHTTTSTFDGAKWLRIVSKGDGYASASVSTLAAGSAATVTQSGSGEAKTLAFGIPKGDKGDPGTNGSGFISATASTLSAGASATVTIGGSGASQTLAFGIPRGDTGATGPAGAAWSYLPAAGGAVKAALAAALPANTYSAGVLTASANGAFPTVDGVTINLNDRIWVWDYTGANGSDLKYGIYTLTQVGDAGAPWILTRATDADTAGELGYISAYVAQGTANAGLVLAVTLASGSITVGTTPLVVSIVSGNASVASEAAARAAEDASINAQLAVLTVASGADTPLRQTGMAGGDLLADVSTAITPSNRTDGAASGKTITHAGGGLSVVQTTDSRVFSYPISRKLGAKYNKATFTCVTSTAGAGTGFGIELNDGGSNYLVAYYQTNGRINFVAGGTASAPALLTGLPTWSSGATLTLTIGLDSSGNVQLTVSNGTQTGGAAFVVPTSCINVGLVQYGTTTAVWSMSQEAVSSAASNRISSAISSSIPAAQSNFAQLSGLLEVPKPSQITLPVLYSAKFYQDPATGAFFSSRVPTKQLFDTDPTTLVLYVDPDSGSDSNIGTRASPMATLSGAIAFAGTSNLILRLKETEFDYLHGFAGVPPSCLKLQIETWDGGRAIVSTRIKGLTWASNGSGGYTTTLPGSVDCACVFDAANPTAAGDYGYLTKLGSAAAVNAAAASWYSTGSGGTLTVHTVDSRPPDSSIRVYASWSPFANLRTSGPWTYIENVDFEGSGNGSYGCVNSATGTSSTQIFLEMLSCSFKYSNTNGVSVGGYCGVIHKDCIAAQNWNDGFNYHWDVRTSLAPQIIEINPVSRGGGFSKDGSSNASTNHQAGLAVTLNANYTSDNAVVADISGSQRWLLGGTVGPKHLNGDADAYGGDALVMAGNTGDVVASTTVLDNVVLVGDGSYSDIYASVSGSAAYYTNCRFQAGGVTPTKTGGSTATAISRASGPLLGYANVPSAVPVASLPTTAKVGTMMTVTDGAAALSWGATVSGGGSVCYGVRWNGSNWTVYAK